MDHLVCSWLKFPQNMNSKFPPNLNSKNRSVLIMTYDWKDDASHTKLCIFFIFLRDQPSSLIPAIDNLLLCHQWRIYSSCNLGLGGSLHKNNISTLTHWIWLDSFYFTGSRISVHLRSGSKHWKKKNLNNY